MTRRSVEQEHEAMKQVIRKVFLTLLEEDPEVQRLMGLLMEDAIKDEIKAELDRRLEAQQRDPDEGPRRHWGGAFG